MKGNRYLTISEFSKISEVSRRALIFYDNIGLFSPEYTGENGYRYYSHEQIYSIFVINILKESGMSLQEIKAFLQGCTPKSAAMLLQKQGEAVAKKFSGCKAFRICCAPGPAVWPEPRLPQSSISSARRSSPYFSAMLLAWKRPPFQMRPGLDFT